MSTLVLGAITAGIFLLAVLPALQAFSALLWLAGLVCLVVLIAMRTNGS